MPSIAIPEADLGDVVVSPNCQRHSLMADRPGTFEEKKAALLQRHIDYGVGYDERAIYVAAGLDAPKNPRYFEPAKGVKQAIRADERVYRAELAKNALAAKGVAQAENDQARDIAELRAQNERLEAQLTQLLAAVGQAPAEVLNAVPPPALSVVQSTPDPLPVAGTNDGLPQASWDRERVSRWLEAYGYQQLPRKGVGMSKIAMADFAIEQHRKASGESPQPRTEA